MYYTIHLNFCQVKKGTKKMKDDTDDADAERVALRQMIAVAAKQCKDTSTLDLVYQLLTYENKDDRL